MTIQLIQNQELIDSFVHIMLNQETIAQPITTSAPINGMVMNTSEVPQKIKNRLPEIFNLHIVRLQY